ncbi:tRNA lysidine(34) synthetase TilS [Sneathiella sp.]|uniref:tRNA lysidine(34) synthetase TilS n=1 Tax=Sneathiella sp. TaxID=1964365 RepID=UPI0026068516|nr:tRNA lysidine(34) synthetase TilS [Sneathiella sp.]MDF2368110.1 tRNA lysidine(34) synthetase TilS [Sneathiella sp.]
MADSPGVSDLSDFFSETLHALLPTGAAEGIAVAVSGGSDSMALALLAKDWADASGVHLTALTVDHGLRATSADEANQVKHWLDARGIETLILRWAGPSPKTGIQEAARNARYQLMEEACLKAGISKLLLGHQLEDQLETLLMRLSKGSGLDGLSAMESMSERGRLTLLRPLLSVRRNLLRDYLNSRCQGWIDDPSNENPVYTRTRVGAVLTEMQQLPGSNIEAIALSLSRLQRASNSLDVLARQKIDALCEISPLGFIRMQETALDDCPDELALRILSASLRCVGGGQRIKLSALEDLYRRLFKERSGKSGTISGAQTHKSGKSWLFCREPGREGLPLIDLASDEREWIWDNRFIVTDTAPDAPRPDGLTLGPLGVEGWRQLKDRADSKFFSTVPTRVRHSLPSLWSGDEIVALPLLPKEKNAEFGLSQRFNTQFRAFYWMTDPNS